MIFGVDFDGTLSFGQWPECGPENRPLIDFLMKRKELGDRLILWTCRNGDALDAAVNWCREKGIVFDAINDNLPEIIELYGSNSRKITCDYYIDDRSIAGDGYRMLEAMQNE